MGSPFYSFTNAVLMFQIPNGALVADRNGNLRPGTATVEVRALLNQRRDSNAETQPGKDQDSIWVEGYVTQIDDDPESLVLPSVITPDSPCSAIWQGRTGQFRLEFTARNPYLQSLGINLVERIRGYFQPDSFVIEDEDWAPTPSPGPTPTPTPTPTDSSVIKVAFSFGDASPKSIYLAPDNTNIFTSTIVIKTPFNGVGSQLRLGDAGQADRLITTTQVIPTEFGEYQTNPNYTYGTATQINLTITPGAGCTQGSGFVILEV